jgi:hypothetical protein
MALLLVGLAQDGLGQKRGCDLLRANRRPLERQRLGSWHVEPEFWGFVKVLDKI